MITKLYNVSVDIPDNIADKYKDSPEYKRLIDEATKGAIESGSIFYLHLDEWATFHDLKDAQQCERKIMDAIYHFAAKELNN